MPSRTLIICFSLLAAALVGLPATASAAKKISKPTPQITRVTPMRLAVGQKLTIRGRNFKSRKSSNTVIFRNGGGQTAFAKPRSASRTKLVVVVPTSVARLLTVKSSRQQPTRLKLRVLAGRFSPYTPRRLSPVVLGGGAAGGGKNVCTGPGDYDHDLLPNSLEVQIGTDPCLADTDGDGMIDGWEYYAAKDLNVKAVPYPGTRPFPNALDPSDGGGHGQTSSAYDFDGDGLTTLEEYRAWRYTGSSFDPSQAGGIDNSSPLGYSDGTKTSRPFQTPAVPAWRSASYGLSNPTQPFPATYNFYGDAIWHDDERDADADGLANWLESAHGPSNNAWWSAYFGSDRFNPIVDPWKKTSYCGYRFGYFDQRPFANLDLANPDVDGDGLLDGEDDQDNDNVSNIVELYETQGDMDGNGQPAFCGWGAGVVPTIDFGGVTAPVNAMNPCAPDPASRSCPTRIPF
jgi:hypothetical protein